MEVRSILHNALITYAANQDYFFFAPECSYSYSLFFNDPNHFEKFNTFGEEELRDIFISTILPYINEYCLEVFNIPQLKGSLQLNNNYRQTLAGFEIRDISKRLENFLKPICGTDYQVKKPNSDSKISLTLSEKCTSNLQETLNNEAGKEIIDDDKHTVRNNCYMVTEKTQTLLVPHEMHCRQGCDINMNGNNAVLLSATFSNIDELALGVVLKSESIHDRLLVAKNEYETSGKLSNTYKYLETLCEKSYIAYELHKVANALYDLKNQYVKVSNLITKK